MLRLPVATIALVFAASLCASSSGPARAEKTWAALNIPADVALYPKEGGEAAMFADLNDFRKTNKLGHLLIDPDLTAIARAYAKRMLTERFIGHVAPDGSSPASRLQARGCRYTKYGENLVFTTGDETEAFARLVASPPHHHTMMESTFQYVGIGAYSVSVYGTMYVQELTDHRCIGLDFNA